MQNVFHAVFGAFHAGFIEKEGEIWYFQGGHSTDIVLVCTNDTRMDGGLGLTITGMRNVTIKIANPSQTYKGAFYGALKVTDCHGNVTVANPHGAAVVYSLDVDNTAGTGNVTITGSNAKGSMLVWNTAGRPEPAGAPAFADVTDPDMAKAAQWCTEQGTMGAKGDRFDPEGWTPKFKVIEVWNKAFPAA